MHTPELEPEQMPKAIVHWLYAEFLNEGNSAVADQLISPDFSGPAGKGPDGFRASFAPVRQAFPDIHFKIKDEMTEGSRVAVRWTWEGTHQGAFAGIAPTGRRVSNDGIAIYQVEDGLITGVWSQMDRLGVLQQIGAVAPLGAGGAVPPTQAT